MAKKKRGGAATSKGALAKSSAKSAVPPAPQPVTMRRVAKALGARAAAAAAAPAAGSPDAGVPVALIAAGGGPVTIGIAFGQAQHAKYTIQLFDPLGTTELARHAGMNTDAIPDEFTFQATPTQLDQHIIQWSGLVSTFSPGPGQQFSIIVDVTQNGVVVMGGHVVRSGKLTTTQAFVGVLRLVTR